MRFLADMGISQATVRWLRSHGHDAKHLREEGLQRVSDPDIFSKASKEKRIILTFDLDFGVISASSGSKLPSIIIFRLQDERPENVNRVLNTILTEVKKELKKGVIISADENYFRVRHLPIKPASRK
jgi:predicted nuclease of predicted toxin-antitoxin system